MPIVEISPSTIECPEPQLWRMYDEQTAEIEVLEFLYSFVRTLKPRLVVETGAHKGLSASYIGKALRDNDRGKLVTCEIEVPHYRAAKDLIEKCRMEQRVEVKCISSLELEVEGEIDLLFADSLPQLRMKEIDRFWDQLSTHAVILVHDVNSGWHKDLRAEVLREDKDRRLSVVLLPTPRGLAICQKREGRE